MCYQSCQGVCMVVILLVYFTCLFWSTLLSARCFEDYLPGCLVLISAWITILFLIADWIWWSFNKLFFCCANSASETLSLTLSLHVFWTSLSLSASCLDLFAWSPHLDVLPAPRRICLRVCDWSTGFDLDLTELSLQFSLPPCHSSWFKPASTTALYNTRYGLPWERCPINPVTAPYWLFTVWLNIGCCYKIAAIDMVMMELPPSCTSNMLGHAKHLEDLGIICWTQRWIKA